MTSLADQSLQSCLSDSLALSNNDINHYLTQLDNWQLHNKNKINQIIKTFEFKDYISAQNYSNMIAELAEQENHHPCICIEWGKVTITWWTHSIHGLFINDFIMAARCDRAYMT